MQIYRRSYVDGTGKTRKARYWTCAFTIAGRKVRMSTGLTDRNAAQTRAGQLFREAQLRAAGIQTYPQSRARPLLALAEEFCAELVRRRRATSHVNATRKRILELLSGTPTLTQLSAERVRTRLLALSESRRWSPSTQNRYRGALSAFLNWLVREGRWHENPMRQVPAVPVHEPTRRRRAATEEEMRRLLLVAPPYRSIAYLLAASVGLRRSELAALLWSDIDLRSRTVLVRAGSAKNRKEVALPLHAGCIEALRRWRGMVEGDRVFPRGIPGVRTFYRDLATAGIEPVADGGVLDFHALRATFATSLARKGVPLATAQKLLRHSSVDLTARHYTRMELSDLEGAVEKLGYPSPLGGESDGREKLCPELCPKPAETRGKDEEKTEKSDPDGGSVRKGENPSGPRSFGDPKGFKDGAPRRTRTFDPLIKSQLLYQLS